MGSKAGSKKKRSESDFYPTPQVLVRLGIKLAIKRYDLTHGLKDPNLCPLRNMKFLDPGCGPDGRFARTASVMMFGESVGVDILQRSHELHEAKLKMNNVSLHHETDFIDDGGIWATLNGYDVVCGTPPFSLAEKFVRRSLDMVSPDGVVGFILRVGFWESKHRVEFFNDPRNKPAETLIMQQRPSFYKDTGIGPTDGTAYAFFLWDGEMVNRVLRGAGVRPVIDCISWR